MSRIPLVLRQNFTEAQQQLFESITTGKRGQGRTPESFLTPEGGMKGPFNALLFSPVFGEAVQRVGEVVRYESSMPPALREMAILMVAAKWQAHYEWWAHEKIATQEGLDQGIIASLKEGSLPNFTQPAEAVVYHFSRELLNEQQVSDDRYEAAVELLGEAGVVELTVLLGFYVLISMSLNVFKVSLPDGEKVSFGSDM